MDSFPLSLLFSRTFQSHSTQWDIAQKKERPSILLDGICLQKCRFIVQIVNCLRVLPHI